MRIEPRSFGTHDGSFHADEVTAAALLLMFNLIAKDKIYRTRDEDILARCEYVCDVGGVYDREKKRFDHHQKEYTGDKSSAGMILDYLKVKKIITSELQDYFNNSLIIGVDAHDLGRVELQLGFATFSQIVSNFLPVKYNASAEKKDRAFFRALNFVVGHLKRLKERFQYLKKCKIKIKEEMLKNSYALIFKEALPWMESFFELGGARHPACFVIMPTGNQWKLRGIPPTFEKRMQVRIMLPKEWASLRGDDLRRASDIEGAVFCHKGRFISIWETEEAALKALKYVLEKEGKRI